MTYTKAFLDKIQRELNTAVLCDILDELGYRHQAMDGSIAPLAEEDKLVGVARTVLAYDVYEQPKEAYATEIEAVDALREGDIDGVVVVPDEVAQETIDKAFEKIAGENIVREELKKGALLKDVFARYHIL